MKLLRNLCMLGCMVVSIYAIFALSGATHTTLSAEYWLGVVVFNMGLLIYYKLEELFQ